MHRINTTQVTWRETQLLSNEIQNKLSSYALLLTKNTTDAQDLTQETMVKAWKYKEKFQPWTNMQARLYTIMRNTFIDACRKKTKNIHINEKYFAEYTWYHTTYNEWESQIEYDNIINQIENISPTIGEPFYLSYIGYKYEEIAKLFNIPLWTVKARIYRARQELQTSLIQIDANYIHRRQNTAWDR